ncbi:MAG TPA: endolytic transglycosylase MltG [Candidatus Paceibacterota bacterium]|nr:endolytic transglycosylase MltG [Candidatus Paceibacterota bacterium]
MQPFIETLKTYFATLDHWEKSLSARWRENANRRTLIIGIILVIGVLWFYLYVFRPPDNFPIRKVVTLPTGVSGKQVSEILQEDGVVRSALGFRIVATLEGHERTLHAGDYLFTEPENIFAVARTIGTGAFGLQPFKIRIPEGSNTRQMATIFSIELPDFNAQNFLSDAVPLEGYLFPDTYFFLPNATESSVIETMRQDFNTHLATIEPQIEAFGKPLSQDIIMASILEEEAGTTEDRRMIAGVLWNRIARGMPLQADVTLQYTLPKADSQLTRSDLANDSPYNTYTHPGLPPGPIDSPSLDSILAAVTPIKSNYLYYLADKNGVTHYCSSYACQAANEAEYLGK